MLFMFMWLKFPIMEELRTLKSGRDLHYKALNTVAFSFQGAWNREVPLYILLIILESY